MTYSLDYRQRVLGIKDKEKLSYEETAERFGVGIATLFRWKKKLEPQKTRNKPATKIDMEALAKDVEDSPDLYQEERAEKLGVTQRAIGYALKRLKISYKKTLFHPKADEIERIKFQWKIFRYECEGRQIVYLDESGFAVDTPRTHGYSPTGKRCYDFKNWHERGRVNAIGAILNFEFIAIDIWDCYIDSDVFYEWLTKSLIPKLPPYSVVVMDNASFHKRDDMIQAVETEGHTLEFLPPYSPDLNPIERKWAQTKSIRRKLKCDPYQLFSYV